MTLSPRLCSVHTHSVLCDGKNTIAEMADAAYSAGVRYFGVSGHSCTKIPWDEGNVLSEDLTEYIGQTARVREKYAGRMEILLGLELDSCTEEIPAGLDYTIGSVHNLFDRESGRYFALDWDAERLKHCVDELFGGDVNGLIDRYFDDVGSVAEKKPDILGHIDLITKLNGDGAFFDEECRSYRAGALGALERADPEKTLLEINTGAVARGYRKKPYPALFILKRWRERGGEVIITSDAHSADCIVFGYDDASKLAREAGFSHSVLLTGEGWRAADL